jgi:hypothetical protein
VRESGDYYADIQINDLSRFMSDLPVLPWRQKISVDRKRFDNIRVGDLFQCLADMAVLPTRLASACCLGLFLPARIGHRRFTAVTTVDQDGDQENQNLKASLERRGEIFLLLDQSNNLFDRFVYIDIVYRHELPRVCVMLHYNTGFKNGFFVSRMLITAFPKFLQSQRNEHSSAAQHGPSGPIFGAQGDKPAILASCKMISDFICDKKQSNIWAFLKMGSCWSYVIHSKLRVGQQLFEFFQVEKLLNQKRNNMVNDMRKEYDF